MADQPLISIVTPSYNQGRFIAITLDSILKQDYANVESIVMDGGSTDETVSILQNYGDDRLKWVSEKDKGQTDALNKGMRQARGDILAYLNSDDVYMPGALSAVAAYFQQHPDVMVLCGKCHQIDGDGNILKEKLALNPPTTIKRAFSRKIFIAQPAVFWRREVTQKIGLFDETLHYAMDHDYWLRMLLAGYKLTAFPQYLAGFRLHGTSKTVSQATRFWKDWEAIVNKVFAMPDLPPDVLALRPLAETYVHYHAAEMLLKFGGREEKRSAAPHARAVLTQGDTLKLRLIGAAMLADSVLNTSLLNLSTRLYRTARGIE